MNTSKQATLGSSFECLLDLKKIERLKTFDQDRSNAVTLPLFYIYIT